MTEFLLALDGNFDQGSCLSHVGTEGLWAGSDAVGTLGHVFLDLGRAAVPALKTLLDNETPRTAYEGSEEATEMAMRRYRVKDFAAYYLSRIMNAKLPWEPQLAQRDQAIALLRAQLP